MNENTPTFNQQRKREGTIVLTVVVAANLAYLGWRWANNETYEDCLKSAAKASAGVHRAYADLREICDNKETVRLIQQTPTPKRQAPTAAEFLDSPLKPVTDPDVLRQLNK